MRRSAVPNKEQNPEYDSVTTDDLTVNGQNGVEEPQDVTSSRAVGTWQTNTTGNPIMVYVRVSVPKGNHADGDVLTIDGDINSSQTINGAAGAVSAQGDGANRLFVSTRMLVPDRSVSSVACVGPPSPAWIVVRPGSMVCFSIVTVSLLMLRGLSVTVSVSLLWSSYTVPTCADP